MLPLQKSLNQFEFLHTIKKVAFEKRYFLKQFNEKINKGISNLFILAINKNQEKVKITNWQTNLKKLTLLSPLPITINQKKYNSEENYI